MQWAGSLGALDRSLTALAYQLPRAVGSASSLTAVLATAVGQACVSPHGKHCSCLVHQPVGRYTITTHVTARPPSPPLESHAVQVTVHIPGKLNRVADTLSQQLTFPGEWQLHPETIRLIWSRFGEAQVDLFASHESSHCQLYFSLTEGPLGTDTQLASDLTQVCVSPSEPTRTDTVQAQGGQEAGPAGCAALAHRDLVSRTHFPHDSTSLAHSSEEGPPLSGAQHHMAPASRSLEPPCVAPGRDVADLSGLPPAVEETITQARAPTTRQTYALKWSLFAN